MQDRSQQVDWESSEPSCAAGWSHAGDVSAAACGVRYLAPDLAGAPRTSRHAELVVWDCWKVRLHPAPAGVVPQCTVRLICTRKHTHATWSGSLRDAGDAMAWYERERLRLLPHQRVPGPVTEEAEEEEPGFNTIVFGRPGLFGAYRPQLARRLRPRLRYRLWDIRAGFGGGIAR